MRSRPLWIAAFSLPVFLFLIFRLQEKIDAGRAALGPEREDLIFTSGKTLHRMSLGYDDLLADIYWTRAVQYYGWKMHTHAGHFEDLYPLLDVCTDLDPRLIVAYHFGAIFLAERGDAGAARPDLAVTLVRKGIAANPNDFYFYGDLGFIYYWYERDYAKASQAYLEGSRVPGAKDWMKVMAARVAAEGRSYETSRLIWMQVLETTRDEIIQKRAQEALKTLRAEQDAEYIEKLVDEFRRRAGREPASFLDLISEGLLRDIPADPAGYPYVLVPGGKVHLHPKSPIQSDILKPPPES